MDRPITGDLVRLPTEDITDIEQFFADIGLRILDQVSVEETWKTNHEVTVQTYMEIDVQA